MAAIVAPAPAPSPLVQALNAALTKYPSLDPNAVRAVAAQEGLGGGIGDNGTSFGPFQLHQGGAYPSSAPQDPQAAQAWATSPEGINYALSQIMHVAGGLKGQSAIDNIVTRFERPANPQREIQGATAAYGNLPPFSASSAPAAAVAIGPPGGATVGLGTAPAAPAPPKGPATPILAALKMLGF